MTKKINKYKDKRYFLRTREPEGTLTRIVFTEFTLSMRDFTLA